MRLLLFLGYLCLCLAFVDHLYQLVGIPLLIVQLHYIIKLTREVVG